MTKYARTIDRNSSVPLYKQIKEILIEELRAASNEPVRPISTEEELVRRFHVSRAPVRQALKDLANEGYVYRERAKGTFPVRDLPIRPPGLQLGGLVGYLREQGLETDSQVLDVGRVQPPENVRSVLGLNQQDKVLKVSRLIFVQEKPLVWTQTYLNVPEDFEPSARELEESESVFLLLERSHGISLSRGEHQIWATGAAVKEAQTLRVDAGDPILMGETKMYTRDDHLIGWRKAAHRADDYKYSFTVHR
ncbi:transcriptional regulator, GntR family [Alteribacillus persepolensis]|uniref:Transcriptional regulator, GntR family n=1 Tax=Alteribacillus persepolensis TaxID=568899 RepID=A0A1G8KI40_9BACI|nr:GntR family transcriptional regulator [Alteribacillus persepolensis]SDI43062.1 transcriptional regulator, GntR family [Alteribacillus persepolensis]